jgi:hypothetical protein
MNDRSKEFFKVAIDAEEAQPPPKHQKLHQEISPITLAPKTDRPLQFYS